jgi:predicted nucleic acid-binding protein
MNGRQARERALDVIGRLPPGDIAIPVQVLGELYNVLVRKAGESPARARAAVLRWSDAFTTIDSTSAGLLAAMDLARDHRLGLWDSLILATAARDECRLLLSEDLHEGFSWGGLTVVNPMSAKPHPLLAAVVAQR